MKLTARTTYTVNGGKEITKDLQIELTSDFTDDDLGRFTLMNKAADALIDQGQIMISAVELVNLPQSQMQ